MKIKTKWFGKVVNGKVQLYEKESYLLHKARLEGKDIELTLDKYREKRTMPQNRYYWGVVVAMIEDAIKDVDMGPLEVHEMLKDKFLCQIITLTGKDGKKEEVKIIKSTTDLNIDDFNDYVDKCVVWAGQFLNITIPLPGEVELEI